MSEVFFFFSYLNAPPPAKAFNSEGKPEHSRIRSPGDSQASYTVIPNTNTGRKSWYVLLEPAGLDQGVTSQGKTLKWHKKKKKKKDYLIIKISKILLEYF